MADMMKVIVEIIGKDSFSPEMMSLSSKLTQIGGAMKSVGQSMMLGVTLPIVGAGIAAVNFASDLEESKNKVSVVFGDWSEDILHFSENAAQAMGLSQQGALEAAGTFGNLFDAMQIGKETNVDMTESLLQLAADLASFNNMDPTDVLEKLRSGLVGETMPLRVLGVNINETLLKTKALELGLLGVGEELTAGARAQAAYALIMEQTTNAQGDFARTSDGLANQQRILKAQLADVGAEIGTILLPFIQQAVTFIGDLVSQFQGLSPEVQQMIVVGAGLAAALGPVLFIVGSLVTAIGAILPVITAVVSFLAGPALVPILLIGAAIALLAAAWKNNWGGIRDIVINLWETKIKPALAALWDWLGTNIPKALEFLRNVWQNVLLPAIMNVWGFIERNVLPVLRTLAEIVGKVLGIAITALAGFWQKVLWPALQQVWAFIDKNIIPVLHSLKEKYIVPLGNSIRLGLAGALDWVNTKLKEFSGWLSSITLPDWLTPGSPTPFELGLRGINKELASIAGATLPRFSGGLRSAGMMTPIAGGAGLAASGGMGVVVQFTYSPVVSFADQREAQEKIAPIIEQVVNRAIEQSRQ